LVEVGYEASADLNLIRQQLSTAGYEDAVVQNFGSSTDVLIRLGETHDPKLGDKVVEALKADGSAVELRRNEYVGAQVGEELREQGGLGMLLALAMIMVYLAFRFQFKFSLGAVLALVHDVTIVLGFFSIMQLDFDLTVLAAVLAVIGYSLNDTIVVYDRIRENFRIMRKGGPLEILNSSLSQTLSRTLVTSLTTALVLVALLVFGGETIRGFAIALLAGVVIGTYSSIYVAANLLLALKITKEDLIPPPKEESEIDEMP
jgi:preprotein translocase subunit SecF